MFGPNDAQRSVSLLGTGQGRLQFKIAPIDALDELVQLSVLKGPPPISPERFPDLLTLTLEGSRIGRPRQAQVRRHLTASHKDRDQRRACDGRTIHGALGSDDRAKTASLRLAERGINFYPWACHDPKPLPA